MRAYPIATGLLMLTACGSGDSNPQGPGDEGGPPVAGCSQGTLESGALSLICFPAAWNGDLVLYAHGYVEPGAPLALPDDQAGGVSISDAVTSLGYAYATTSYRANGLIADQAVEDVAELVAAVRRRVSPDPTRDFVVGFSEGGLVAALSIERHPELVDGVLAACGPVGDFGRQVDYIGDVRVLFDYYYPGILPGTAVDIPDGLRTGWDPTYQPAVVAALTADPAVAGELAAVAGVAVPGGAVGTAMAIAEVLWYNVFATENAEERLGGQPYDNAGRQYSGSADDAALNAGVARFTADDARTNLQAFETSGDLPGPVITLHTSDDPVVPASQETLYAAKVAGKQAGARLQQRTVDRFGHCAFDAAEVLSAFTALTQPASARHLLVARP